MRLNGQIDTLSQAFCWCVRQLVALFVIFVVVIIIIVIIIKACLNKYLAHASDVRCAAVRLCNAVAFCCATPLHFLAQRRCMPLHFLAQRRCILLCNAVAFSYATPLHFLAQRRCILLCNAVAFCCATPLHVVVQRRCILLRLLQQLLDRLTEICSVHLWDYDTTAVSRWHFSRGMP